MSGECMFERVSVVGTGLVGCSVAALVKGRSVAREVVGVDIDNANLDAAKRLGFVDRTFSNHSKGIMGAGAIILAVPLDEVFKVMDAIGKDVRPGALITCAAGTTSRMRKQLVRHVRSAENFVPAYPMIHQKGSGPGSASPGVLDGNLCLLMEKDPIPEKTFEQAKLFWERIGMQTRSMDPESFEALIAGSELWPQVIAMAAGRVVTRSNWPDVDSVLSHWLAAVAAPKAIGREHQLYASRICALCDEFAEEMEEMKRRLGCSLSSSIPEEEG